MIKLSDIKINPANPRSISKEKLEELKNSITQFEKMLSIRPIVVDENNMALGGNMRILALQKLGYTEISEDWINKVENLTEDEKREFIVKDNVAYGEWNWETLTTDWDISQLTEWGVEIPQKWNPEKEEVYTRKIKSPIYEPKNKKPAILSLIDSHKTNKLIQEIEDSTLPAEEKQFLIHAAHRHTVFNYEQIADYYAHCPAETQAFFERSALVIIDFKQAIENGYIQLTKEIMKFYGEEYPDIKE